MAIDSLSAAKPRGSWLMVTGMFLAGVIGGVVALRNFGVGGAAQNLSASTIAQTTSAVPSQPQRAAPSASQVPVSDQAESYTAPKVVDQMPTASRAVSSPTSTGQNTLRYWN